MRQRVSIAMALANDPDVSIEDEQTTALAASLAIGLKTYPLNQLPVLWVAGAGGIWLFYVQHQFEDTYWRKHRDWDYCRAGIQGSSYYDLPRLAHWFTGNIGYHHIHHLDSRGGVDQHGETPGDALARGLELVGEDLRQVGAALDGGDAVPLINLPDRGGGAGAAGAPDAAGVADGAGAASAAASAARAVRAPGSR